MEEYLLAELRKNWGKAKSGARYRQLYFILRQMICENVLPAGTRLPPSRTLADYLSISRNTVTQAFDILQSEGFINARQGAGVYVSTDIDEHLLGQKDGIDDKDERTPALARRSESWLSIKRTHRHVGASVPFSPGIPALSDFPFDVWARLLSRRWRLSGERLAMMDNPAGYGPLRDHLADYLRNTRGIKCQSDQIIIVSGAQQGLDLISRVLWDPEDRIVVEDPAFPGLDAVVQAVGAKLHPVAIDDEGLAVDQIQKGLEVKSFLVTPSRNYPIGTTMSLARRLALLRLARSKQAWIIEDDFDSEFRFEGPPLSSLQGLDADGRVIYVGTFTRIIFPGLRLGYVVVPEKLIEAFVAAKSYIDGHASSVHQAALADFFQEGYFASHLRKMKRLYKARREYLIAGISRLLEDQVEVVAADGGLHICLLLSKMDDQRLSDELRELGVVVRPLSAYYKLFPKKQGFILGYAGFSEKQIDAALQQLAKKLRET